MAGGFPFSPGKPASSPGLVAGYMQTAVPGSLLFIDLPGGVDLPAGLFHGGAGDFFKEKGRFKRVLDKQGALVHGALIMVFAGGRCKKPKRRREGKTGQENKEKNFPFLLAEENLGRKGSEDI